MIASIRGVVLEALPNRLIIDVGGVGYLILVPLSTFDRLHPVVGEECSLVTYLHVRENGMILYGFASAEEKDLFLLLIERVSGIGPAIGMAILSGMAVEQFKSAVINGDVAMLSQVKGLGKKTAERIILELKDKVGVAEAWEAAHGAQGTPEMKGAHDAELALIALGYKQGEARKAVQKVLASEGALDVNELIRLALRQLN